MKASSSSSSSTSSIIRSITATGPPSSLHYDADVATTPAAASAGGAHGSQRPTQRQPQRRMFVPTLGTIPSHKVVQQRPSSSSSRSRPNNYYVQLKLAAGTIATRTATAREKRQPTPSSTVRQYGQQHKTTKTDAPTNTNIKKTKRYRRVKRLKPCVPRLIFLVPLAILALERYIGQIIQLDDATTAIYDQVGYDPFAPTLSLDGFNVAFGTTKDTAATSTAITGLLYGKSSSTQPKSTVPTLMNITHTPSFKCHSRDQKRMLNIHNKYSHHRQPPINNKTIPLIVHQQGPTRCLTHQFDRAAVQWAGLKRWSYYFWDDDSVDRLLQLLSTPSGGSGSIRDLAHPEFPLLQSAILISKCYDEMSSNKRNRKSEQNDGYDSSSSMSKQLWQFLALWFYGGMYVDLNYFPTGFNSTTTIGDTDHGVFFLVDDLVLDGAAATTFIRGSQMLTSKILAVTPKHPIIYLSIQHLIKKILSVGENHHHRQSNDSNIAQSSLNKGWDDYKQGFVQPNGAATKSKTNKAQQQQQRSNLRIVGVIGNDHTEWIAPVFKTEQKKRREYDVLLEQKERQRQAGYKTGTDMKVGGKSHGEARGCHFGVLWHDRH